MACPPPPPHAAPKVSPYSVRDGVRFRRDWRAAAAAGLAILFLIVLLVHTGTRARRDTPSSNVFAKHKAVEISPPRT